MRTNNRHFIPKWYYYATPLFILLDYLLGINIRVAALDALPLHKNVYYGFCIICAICIFIFPRYSPIVALVESTINVLLMALLLVIPYTLLLSTEDALSTDSPIAQMFTIPRILNIGFAGFIAVFAFRASINKLGTSPILQEQAPIHPPGSETDKQPNSLTLH